MEKILIIEQDRQLAQLYARTLEKSGYGTQIVNEPAQAETKLSEAVDLALIGSTQPEEQGLDLLKQIREAGIQIPVLLIGAKPCLDSISQSLLTGRETFLMQPVDMNRLVDRIRALLHRCESLSQQQLILGKTVLRRENCTVDSSSGSTVLPKREFDLLLQLAACPGKIMTVQQLLNGAGGGQGSLERSMEHLRECFRESTDFHIVQMRGIGYKLCPVC